MLQLSNETKRGLNVSVQTDHMLSGLTNMTNKEQILIALLNGQRVIRLGKLYWQWEDRTIPNKPPLKNNDTSSLFRANFVTEINNEMILTEIGKLVAKRLMM